MLRRLKMLLQAAIDDIVAKASDPELELARFVEEVEVSLGEIRAELEEAQLRRTELVCRAAEYRRTADEWMKKAEAAAARDEDGPAKEALRGRREALVEAGGCDERAVQAELTLAALHKDEEQLERKLAEARREQKRLSAEMRRAEAQKRAGEALADSDKDAPAVDRMRGQVMETEAAGEAVHEVEAVGLDAELARLDDGPSLDDELAALKRRLKGGKGKNAS